MINQQKAGGLAPGDPLGPAHLGKQAGAAGANVARLPQPHYTKPRSPCQPLWPGDLAELAQDALKRAWAAGLLAQACELVGDPLGRAGWLKRRALHLAIYYSATHPREATT